MPITYIFSQVFAFLWFIFLVLSYFTKSITKIRILNFANAFCLLISLLLLNAHTGIGAVAIGMILPLILTHPYFSNNKNYTIVHIVLLLFSWLAMTVITVFTYVGWPSLLPCIAFLIHSYSLLQRRAIVYKYMQIPQCFLYFIYYVKISSIIAATAEFPILAMLLIGIFTDLKRNK